MPSSNVALNGNTPRLEQGCATISLKIEQQYAKLCPDLIDYLKVRTLLDFYGASSFAGTIFLLPPSSVIAK